MRRMIEMAGLNISKFTVTRTTVSVPVTADRKKLEELLERRIREMEQHTAVLKYELLIVQRHV
jgi:hypothetical protein